MRKLIALTLVAFLAIPGIATADDELEGVAELHSFNSSGVTGVFEFEDDGEFLRIEGTAQGLDPGVSYVSLIYDNRSNADPARTTDPFACEPAIFNPGDPDFILDTMFVGFWNVDEDGEGTLEMTNIREESGPGIFTGASVHVGLDKFHTISIRDLTVDGGFPPTAVVACGVEVTEGDDD